jgi:hypothetical protein
VLLWYEAMYGVFAVMCTGLGKATFCQPDVVSAVEVVVASSCPPLVHRFTVCGPVFCTPL